VARDAGGSGQGDEMTSEVISLDPPK